MKMNFKLWIFEQIHNKSTLLEHSFRNRWSDGLSFEGPKQPEKILKIIVTSNKIYNIAVFLKDFSDMHASVDDGLCMHVLSDKRAT